MQNFLVGGLHECFGGGLGWFCDGLQLVGHGLSTFVMCCKCGVQ